MTCFVTLQSKLLGEKIFLPCKTEQTGIISNDILSETKTIQKGNNQIEKEDSARRK